MAGVRAKPTELFERAEVLHVTEQYDEAIALFRRASHRGVRPLAADGGAAESGTGGACESP